MKFDLIKKRSFVAVIAMALASSMMTACSGKQRTSTMPTANTALKLLGSTRNIEEGKLASPWNKIELSTRLVYRNIFEIDPATDEIKPDLAESYTLSDDGLVYQIVFRDDLVWSDGEAITLDDVIFSFETILKVNGDIAILPNSFLWIDGAKEFVSGEADHISGLATDGNTLIVTLETPKSLFATVLTQFAIMPEHALKDVPHDTFFQSEFWNAPVVSGMYQFDEYIDGEQLTYTYNEKYVGDVPQIESVVLRSDYAYSEVDCYTTSDVTTLMEFRSVPKMKEYDISTLLYRYLVYNSVKDGEIDPVMGNLKIREGISHAVDTVSLVSDVYYNTAHMIETGGVLFDSTNLDGLAATYNPEKAKELLAEGGYDFDRPLVLLSYLDDTLSQNLVKGIAKNLEEVGFTVEIVFDGDLYSDEFDYYDVALKELAALDVYEWYQEYHSSHILYQEVYGQEPVFDDLIQELNLATTEEEQKMALAKLQLRGVEVTYKFPLFFLGYKAYVNTSRLSVPDGLVLGNPEYRYDIHFEEWEIKSTD